MVSLGSWLCAKKNLPITVNRLLLINIPILSAYMVGHKHPSQLQTPYLEQITIEKGPSTQNASVCSLNWFARYVHHSPGHGLTPFPLQGSGIKIVN